MRFPRATHPYIRTWEGWMYLAAVMDVYNREIIGWALHDRLNKDFVVHALMKALKTRSPQPGLIFHFNRGSQYASDKVKKILKGWSIHQSMSNKGNCFDNAMMESFFSLLKKELTHLMTFYTKDQARRAVFEYIEIFYNRQRRHSALNQKALWSIIRMHLKLFRVSVFSGEDQMLSTDNFD